MGSSRWIDDDRIRRKQTPSFPSHECVVSRNAQKQKRWKIIYSLLCRWGTIETVFRTIIFVNQYRRSSLRFVLGIQWMSNKNGETRVGRTIWPIVRASKIIDNDTYTFDCNPCTRKSFAKVQGTSGKALTTKPSDKDLYWCRIPENSWSRTIFHEKTYWRVLTICRASDMSWVHFANRWKIIWPERLDSREHQNWTVLEVTTSYLQGKHGVEISIESRTILTRGSEFLMAWISWSRTWATRRTTTTSRKPLWCSSKN